MKVSIVIPNYNGELLLEKNLPSVLLATDNLKNEIKEVVVVDDASSDDSVSFIKSNYPTVRLIKHTKNRGVSATMNTGVRSARGELICLLNSDVSPSKDFLVNVLPHFRDKQLFAVSLHEKGYGWAKGFFDGCYIGHESGEESEKVHATFWASGGSAVYKRSLWTKVGGMDENLFSPFYWEDKDLSYRALKRGYKILWEPNSHVVHEHESTMKKLPQRRLLRVRERNQLLFVWKNVTSQSLTRRHLVGLFKRASRHPGYLLIVFMALLKIRATLRARKKERKEAKISDETILARFK